MAWTDGAPYDPFSATKDILAGAKPVRPKQALAPPDEGAAQGGGYLPFELRPQVRAGIQQEGPPDARPAPLPDLLTRARQQGLALGARIPPPRFSSAYGTALGALQAGMPPAASPPSPPPVQLGHPTMEGINNAMALAGQAQRSMARIQQVTPAIDLFNTIESLDLSDHDRRYLHNASGYILQQMQAGQPFAEVLRDVLGTPHMSTAQAAATLVGEPFRIASEGLKALPASGIPTSALDALHIPESIAPRGTLGEAFEQSPAPQRIAGEFALNAAPYIVGQIAATAVNPTLGAATLTLFNAQAGLQAEAIAQSYQAGQIDERTALAQLGMMVGPVLAPAVLHYGVAGTRALVDAAPEVQARLAPVARRIVTEERGSVGQPPAGEGGTLPEEPVRPDAVPEGPLRPQEGAQAALAPEVAPEGVRPAEGAPAAIPAEMTSPAPPEPAQPAAGDGGAGLPPAEPPVATGGGFVPPSEQFPDLVHRYTTEQREVFDRINSNAETQARVKGFGSVRKAIEAGTAPDAPLIARAKAATQRLLSPLYYVRNANVLADERFATLRLAHARQLAVGAQDAQAIAIRLAEKGAAAGLFKDRDTWAKAYHGPAPANAAQKALIGYIGDVIERPDQYTMPALTRAFLRANQRFLLSRLRYAKSQGVDINEFTGDFLTHIYKERPGESVTAAGPGGGVGARQATQKNRVFGSYWDAAKRGFEPEFVGKGDQRGVFEALTRTHQAQIQKAISDHELIEQIKASTMRTTAPRRGYMQTTLPGLSGSYFKRDVAEAINETLGREGRSTFERAVLIPSDIAKTTMATLDASPLLGIQGARRLLDNPARGLYDIGKATQLVASDDAWRSWLTANDDLMRQAAADGTNLFQDFKVTTEGSTPSLIAHIPLLGRLESAANDRFYGRGVAMYKALSYAENKAQIEFGQGVAGALSPAIKRRLASGETPGQIAAQHVNNIYGGLERALRGQSQGYQSFERFLMFAPDFTRAQVGLVATAAGKALTPQGAASLRFLLGSLAISAGVAELMTQAASGGKQHANLTDPRLGDWLTIKTPAGNISFLGPLRTYMRTAYNAAEDAKSGDFERVLGDVEFFGKTRLGPVPSNVMAQLQNRDVLGRPVTTAAPNSLQDIAQRAQFTAKGIAPFGIQQTAEAVGKGGALPVGIAAVSALGFSIFPERLRTSLNEVARERFGRDYNELSPGEKAEIGAEPGVQRAFAEMDQETQAKADAGDPIATVLMAEKAANDRYAASMASIENLPPDQWRQQYYEIRDARFAALDALRNTDARPVRDFFARLDARKPATPRLQVLHDYFAIFDNYRNPATGQVDPDQVAPLNDALDQFEAGLSDQQSADLQADIGAKDTPMQAAYRRDVKELADSGYFDIAERGFQSQTWRRAFADAGYAAAANYPSLTDFRNAYVQHFAPDVNDVVARSDAERAFDHIPVVAQFQRALTQARQTWFANAPELLVSATKWGFNTLSARERQLLPATAGPQ